MAKQNNQDRGGAAVATPPVQFEPIDPRTVAPPGAVAGAPPVAVDPAPAPARAATREGAAVMIEVPVMPSDGYAVRHLDRPLGVHDAETLRDIANALHTERETLADGRIVQTPFDAVCWLIQRVRLGNQQ